MTTLAQDNVQEPDYETLFNLYDDVEKMYLLTGGISADCDNDFSKYEALTPYALEKIKQVQDLVNSTALDCVADLWAELHKIYG